MKKSVAVSLIMMLMLTGCGSENTENNKTEEETMITEIEGISFEHNLTNEELEKIFYEYIGDYYDGTKEADFDKCFGHFPDFYMEMLEKEVKVCNQTHEQYMQDILLDYKLNYGDDFDITYKISEDEQKNKGILCLSTDSVEQIKEIFKETYSKDVNVEEAYTIYADVTTKGSVDTYSEQMKWFLLKIDGNMYLYEAYYETNTIQE